ncbi:MAG: peroxiredoxin family protein [Crocinitomicaceae bacterium]
MKLTLITLVCVLSFAIQAKANSIKNGKWQFHLSITSTHKITVNALVSNENLVLMNGEERIKLNPFTHQNDTLVADFPLYHSSLFITFISKNECRGYWKNYFKKGNYRIPFVATRKHKKTKSTNPSAFVGKWETTIQYSKPTRLIGDFKYSKGSLTGTFRSETGDYRFLSGNVVDDNMYLSCFDGTHCYLFTAKLNSNDSLVGRFYSGNHYQTTWTAFKNPSATLHDPDSLTFLTNDSAIVFTLPSTNQKEYHFSSLSSNKPTIIQIFGSWCPNCTDETEFLKELNNTYHNKVNILGVGFEMGKTDKERMAHLIKYQKQLGINYPILLGGPAQKKEAAKLFPMLNHIMSFPTLIVINRKGETVKVHTGFNGPATGEHYTKFKTDLVGLLNELVQ